VSFPLLITSTAQHLNRNRHSTKARRKLVSCDLPSQLSALTAGDEANAELVGNEEFISS
jgi:hypothetical protein